MKIGTSWIFGALWLGVFGLARAAEVEPREGAPLVLGQGEQRLLRFNGLKKYSIGSEHVRAVPAPQGNQHALLLKGVSPGLSDLWVWKSDGGLEHRSIQVEKTTAWTTGTEPALQRALGRLEEIEAIYSGAGEAGAAKTAWRLRGEIRTENEAARVHALVAGFPERVIDDTVASPSLLERAGAAIERWLSTSSARETLRYERDDSTGTLWVRGSLPDPSAKRAIERRIRAIYPLTQIELTSLPDKNSVVHFKVYLLEIKRTKLRALGLDWNPTPGSIAVSSSRIASSGALAATIQAMEGDGTARVLSAPELVVRAPGEAELFSGGELPIESHTPYATQVSWRQYGLLLKLKVTHASGAQVRTDIMTEVSHLDAALTLKKIPGIQANRMKTQVDAAFGRPLFLSGLLQEDVRRSARGLPFLKRLPVLGLLFGSEDYQEARSELVAILVPSLDLPRAPLSRFRRLGVR